MYHDPGPPPYLDPGGRYRHSAAYQWGFVLVSIWSSHLDPADGVLWDISPAAIGNVPQLPRSMEAYPAFYDLFEGGDPGQGHELNPRTGQPYSPQWVPRADYARVLAEFWADGPDSETPPGHWFPILNYVNDHPALVRRFRGHGPVLDDLEWDVKAYFALGGAVHDAAIAAWGVKGWYDYIRPISAIRGMAERGQSSDPELPRYAPDGIPLVEGYVELVREGDALAGERGEHVGKVKLYAWRGPGAIERPASDVAGVGWILAENWWPYQRPSFVTPPFAGYVSGHSTYSRAGAEVLTLVNRRRVLSRWHRGVPGRKERVPGVRGWPERRPDAAVGHLPGRRGPVQPVPHLGRHPPSRRRHSRPPDRGAGGHRRLPPRRTLFLWPGRVRGQGAGCEAATGRRISSRESMGGSSTCDLLPSGQTTSRSCTSLPAASPKPK